MANTNHHALISEEHELASQTLTATEDDIPASTGPAQASNGIQSSESQKTAPALSSDNRPASGSIRPSLVQLGSGSAQSLTTSQPKRFSAVNINKKFLEKNSSASVSSTTSQPAIKAGTSASTRPQAQLSISHSRLVTAKLTSASPASSTSGAGWSRSSSVAPPNPVGTHSPGNNSPPPTTSLGTTTISAAPQLPHANKLIQPQPKTAVIQLGNSQKDATGLNKPAWGNIKPPSASKRPDVRDDFPTAAEVASSLRTTKLIEVREAVDPAAASKQARMEEADTFRGLHLDPNAHHWDEMEEDDDNFLDGVIEFGDGRQYKIETIDGPLLDSMMNPKSAAELQTESGLDNNAPIKDTFPSIPVSKEERFADDFDRSWPRSRPSPSSSRELSLPPSQSGQPQPPPTANAQDTRNSQESSKVLFNERSNRLEPYSNSQRPGPSQYTSNRRSWQDSSPSQMEPRNSREIAASSQPHNVQLLHKHGNSDIHPRRRFSNANAASVNALGTGSNGDRDQLLKRDGPLPSPRLTKDSLGQPRKEPLVERGRQSHMGPPPLPMHVMRGSEGDGVRQPPRLTQVQPDVFARQGRRNSRDSQFGPNSAESTESDSAHLPSQSPVLSHVSASRISPITPTSPLPNLSAPEFDEARKDLMQSAAARAKQRRQQEEEEREKEKERARRKAAELEERIKAAEAEKKAAQLKLEEEQLLIRQREEEAIAVIEDAIKGVRAPPDSSDTQETIGLTIRTSSHKGSARISDSSKTLSPQQQSAPGAGILSPSSPATQAESWRSRASPLYPISTSQTKQTILSFAPSSQSALNQMESLADDREDLEIVDFSDMGKFLGVPDVSESERDKDSEEKTSVAHPLSSRPTASDFFDDSSYVQSSTTLVVVEKPWRPKLSQNMRSERPATSQLEANHEFSQIDEFSTKPLRTSAATDQHSQILVLPPQPSTIRSPRNQPSYKEPAMTAFDDTISRIKGVLDEMQAGDSVSNEAASDSKSSIKDGHPLVAGRLSTPKERWVPPALRHRIFVEALDINSSEPPPPTPTPGCVVRLPSVSWLLGPAIKRQPKPASKASYLLHMEILSFDPPVEGMNSQNLSVNEVLFYQPTGFQGQPKYRVHLPRGRPGPRVNIPAHVFQPRNSTGAFGRPTGTDLKTWRKPLTTKLGPDEGISSGLATTSRSPPPDPTGSGVSVTSVAVSEPPATTKTDGAKFRAPKMPAGSSVAFYRDSRIDTVEDLKPSVNFIVRSELESRQPSHTSMPGKSQPSITVTPPNTASLSSDSSHTTTLSLINGAKEPPSESQILNSPDKKISEDNTEPITSASPLTHHWTRASLTVPLKESSARGPDPEHLKAVWSQTSNQPGPHGVNSLEGIGDDLTALPFTLQDVKSEDGETPPPSVSTAPSRMSLHDVTRAFQQVPSSSNHSPSHRTPPLAAPPARPANYYTVPPPPASAMRPGYPYPSPIMNHSPSPGVMYPSMLPSSPTPGRMPVNGLYSQPMWVPMSAAATQQNHTNMMRQYSTQIMPYSPGPPPIYAPQPPAMQSPHQANGAPTNRDHLMSPVMSHTGPTMYGSPVLMHAPVMPVPPPNPNYMISSGRGQARTDNSQVPIQNSQQLSHVQPHPGFNSIPSSSFTRTTW